MFTAKEDLNRRATLDGGGRRAEPLEEEFQQRPAIEMGEWCDSRSTGPGEDSEREWQNPKAP